MPGISFLFKKRFHPSRMDNQKRVFVTEENKKKHLEQEKELALQVAKERELQMYEDLGKAPELDPRNASLKFMYHAPAALTKSKKVDDADDGKKKDNSNEKIDVLAKEAPVKLDENGDDDHVRAFRAKFLPSTANNASSIHAEHSEEELVFGPLPPPIPQDDHDSEDTVSIEEDNAKAAALLPTHYHQSSLEQAIGRKKQAILTADELQARHPILKNAPTQGSYAKHTAVKHKPFHVVIRNVRCLRCGEWGHCSGDRECLLKDHNPLDFDRQLREDPMTHYTNTNMAQNRLFSSNATPNDHSNQTKSTKGTISAAQARQYFFGDDINSSSKDDSGGYISSDPEGEFLKTLTRREKKLLLRKLHHLQSPNDSSAAGIDSSSDSSGSSRSDSDDNSSASSDESSRRKKHKKKKHRRHRHKKDRKRRDRETYDDARHSSTEGNQSPSSGKRPRLH